MAQSSELASGAGFRFEDQVGGHYLAALLTESYAAGTGDRQVTQVAFQQRDFGEPLDDLIVDAVGLDGEAARLSLQVKCSLTISSATSNTDFRSIVRDSLATLNKVGFKQGVDRYGAVVGVVAKDKAKAIGRLVDMARNSVETSHFDARFASGGNASQAVRAVLADIKTLVAEFSGGRSSSEDIHRFLAHFTLIEFDFQKPASAARPEALNHLQEAIAPDSPADAPLVWAKLCQLVGEASRSAGVFDRRRLVQDLKSSTRLRAARSLAPDLQKVSELTTLWIADIENHVNGAHLQRPALRHRLRTSLAEARLIQIRGLPGSGKSVLMRSEVEAELANGPVLFLKHDRLEGGSWATFAKACGLSAVAIADLLVEIGAVGSPVLFIDGIDRIEKEHQGIVLDLVRTIMTSPALADWRVVLSLRDSGIGPLRNWLDDALTSLGVATLDVGELNDDEAESLAAAHPHLRPLLFGGGAVQEIVRRPFFAKILQRATTGGAGVFEARSEVDLLRNWWAHGGYSAAGQDALSRQRAIIDLGRQHARALSRPIAIGALSPQTLLVIDALVSDGVLQPVKPGLTLRFSHDIFFEWAFFHVLADSAETWPDEIAAAGQPPAVARVVELLSQAEFGDGAWRETLDRLNGSSLRSQWTRAWLLGPISKPNFHQQAEAYADVLFAEDFAFLRKALVWFQAERTTPNANVLAGDLPADERVRFADMLGWPSDVMTWSRLIWFLIRRVGQIPARLRPDIVAVFEVWQNMLADMRNPVSEALLGEVASWLAEMEADDEDSIGRWRRAREGGDLRASLVRVLLRAARSYPDHTQAYLQRLTQRSEIGDADFGQVAAFSWLLAQTHPAGLVDVTLRHLKEELPADKDAREREKNLRASETRCRALAKPEAERTREEQFAAQGMFMSLGHSVSRHDWDSLAVDRDLKNFFPASPLHEPFKALFEHAPDEALRLLADLSNHATTAWRQLHDLDYEGRGTPLPVSLDFPWGQQIFWGGEHQYLWSRGMWAPKAIACGYMALEDWCMAQLDQGADPDGLIQRIVNGNESVAVLGAAVAIALQSETISGTVFPLVTSQRLWAADRTRVEKDFVDSRANLIGFEWHKDQAHIEAIEHANARAIRRTDLQRLAQRYVWTAEALSEPTKQTIRRFPEDLPFLYEEQRTSPEMIAALYERAQQYAEAADPGNYTAYRTDDPNQLAIVHTPPSATTAEAQNKQARAAAVLLELNLWSWACKTVEAGSLDAAFAVAGAIEAARTLDHSGLFEEPDDEDETRSMRRGAVAATAAVALIHREGVSATDVKWARRTIQRATRTSETTGVFWSSRMVVPWHQAVFAARGLAADIRAEGPSAGLAKPLLELVAHPLQTVSLAAFEEAMSLLVSDPPLAWAAFGLAFDLCDIQPRPRRPGPQQDAIHTPARVRQAVKTAFKAYRAGAVWGPIKPPPEPWVPIADAVRRQRAFNEDIDDEEGPEDGAQWGPNSIHWHHQYAAELIRRIPFEPILASPGKAELLAFMTSLLDWTINKLSPPWSQQRGRDRSSRIYEWTHALGGDLARLCGLVDLVDFDAPLLQPMLRLEGENAYQLLSPFVDGFICRYVFDSAVVPAHAIPVLDVCLDRFLSDRALDRGAYRAGELSGFDQPRLAEAFMFVQVAHASGAARFANGDWSEVALIVPLVDKFARAAAWAPNVMRHFLTLCERARATYPATLYAEAVLGVLELGRDEPLKNWHGTFLAARTAGLVQHFADRETPMPPPLAQAMLRILDFLVDMGDRRSAAMQLSETFREVQLRSVADPARA